jgi:hypothetical protein
MASFESAGQPRSCFVNHRSLSYVFVVSQPSGGGHCFCPPPKSPSLFLDPIIVCLGDFAMQYLFAIRVMSIPLFLPYSGPLCAGGCFKGASNLHCYVNRPECQGYFPPWLSEQVGLWPDKSPASARREETGFVCHAANSAEQAWKCLSLGKAVGSVRCNPRNDTEM